MLQPDTRQHRSRSLPAFGSTQGLRAQRKFDISKDRQAQHHRVLEDHRQALIRAQRAAPVQGTAIGRQQAGDQAQQQGLADTVGAENEADALATQRQIDAIEHDAPGRSKTQRREGQWKHQP